MRTVSRLVLFVVVCAMVATGVASAGPEDQCDSPGVECTDNGDGTLTVCKASGRCTTVVMDTTTTTATTTTTTVPPTTTTTTTLPPTTTTTTVPPTTTTVPPTTTTTTTTTTTPPPVVPMLEGNYSATVTIPAGETWVLGNNVTIDGALIVKGTLSAIDGDGVVGDRTLTFVNVNETTFTDGGLDPDPELNPGLFTVDAGRLDLYGDSKGLGWSNNGAYPAEWLTTDELVAAPYLRGDTTFVPWTLGHPVDGVTSAYPREIINLTRSITIQGTDGGRVHWLNRSSAPQNAQWVEFRYMGVRSVDGRYPIHFHHNGDGSRGSILHGILVRDSGHRAYVPHASHGVSISESVGYETVGESFWWDVPDAGGEIEDREIHFSDDTVVDRMLIAGQSEFGTGFLVGGGVGNVVSNTTIVANRDGQTCMHWPGILNGLDNVWIVENVTVHNCISGLDFWQNEMKVHLIDGFVSYSNETGIDHGAYNNVDHYRDGLIFGNGIGLRIHARTSGLNEQQLTFDNLVFDDNERDVVMAFTSFGGTDATVVFIGGYLETFVWDDAKPSSNPDDPQQVATNVAAYDVGGLVISGITQENAVVPASNGSRPGSTLNYYDANGSLLWTFETSQTPR